MATLGRPTFIDNVDSPRVYLETIVRTDRIGTARCSTNARRSVHRANRDYRELTQTFPRVIQFRYDRFVSAGSPLILARNNPSLGFDESDESNHDEVEDRKR